MSNELFVQVAVEAPLPQTLTYRLPTELHAIPLGSRVQVPLGKRKAKGVVVSITSSYDFKDLDVSKVRPVESAFMDEPALGPKTQAWLKWVAHYYLHPPGQVYSLAFPKLSEKRKRVSKKRPLISSEKIQAQEARLKANPQQTQAIEKITASITTGEFKPYLLFGVTGSGKTEVYLQSIERALALGRQVLVLLPEISLTPQALSRFARRFGDRIAVIHSELTGRERADQWWGAIQGKKDILIGARSALFCPLENLGLIIVDEEHESSFKQEEMLKYNARDCAVMRAKFSNCPVVLGSATPSLESWQNVLDEKYLLLELPGRIEDRPLPSVEIVDLRIEQLRHKEQSNAIKGSSPQARAEQKEREKNFVFWMTPQLRGALKEVLSRHEQAALFLNRRGFASLVICPACGQNQQCPNCSVTLTLHARDKTLHCHYCNLIKPLPPLCPACGESEMKPVGLGTQRIVDDLKAEFPNARIARADRDEITSREELEDLIEKMETDQIDILVGTQMIAKGHDFPNITFVGVVMADLGLHVPDFRASERTFQLLTQVAGRAGRHEKPGHVVIQSLMPEHPAITHAMRQDFKGFAAEELAMRYDLSYPPLGKLVCIRLQGNDERRTAKMADVLKLRAEKFIRTRQEFEDIDLLGPAESPLAKLRGKFRHQILLKNRSILKLSSFAQLLTSNLDWLEPSVKLAVDVDPINLM